MQPQGHMYILQTPWAQPRQLNSPQAFFTFAIVQETISPIDKQSCCPALFGLFQYPGLFLL